MTKNYHRENEYRNLELRLHDMKRRLDEACAAALVESEGAIIAVREQVAIDRTTRAVRSIESNMRINQRLDDLGISVFLTNNGESK